MHHGLTRSAQTNGAANAREKEQTLACSTSLNQRAFKLWVDARPIADVNRYELQNGRIIAIPPAGWEHGEIEARLGHVVSAFVASNQLGKVFASSAGYNLPSGDTLEPDLSFISTERWKVGPHVPGDQYLRIVPNLVIEILSRSTAGRDRGSKKRLYQKNGVDELWLVHPSKREITVFHRTRYGFNSGNRFGIEASLHSRQLPNLALPVRKVFT